MKRWIGHLTHTTEAWLKGGADLSPMAMRVEEELSLSFFGGVCGVLVCSMCSKLQSP